MPTSTQPTIRIEVKDVYGVRTAYPVCENARTFALIAGTKTLTRETLARIKDLGYAVQLVAPEYNV